MISISMIVSDVDGSFILNNTQKCDFGHRPSRISRVATLDGGAVIVNSGISHGDRTFSIESRVSKADMEAFGYIYETSAAVMVVISDGLFYGVISDFEDKNGLLKATILIKNKEN